MPYPVIEHPTSSYLKNGKVTKASLVPAFVRQVASSDRYLQQKSPLPGRTRYNSRSVVNKRNGETPRGAGTGAGKEPSDTMEETRGRSAKQPEFRVHLLAPGE